jgi:hypothetical protein
MEMTPHRGGIDGRQRIVDEGEMIFPELPTVHQTLNEFTVCNDDVGPRSGTRHRGAGSRGYRLGSRGSRVEGS